MSTSDRLAGLADRLERDAETGEYAGGHYAAEVLTDVVRRIRRELMLAPAMTDAELTLARVRALVAEHPADAVPVIEVAELRRALGMPQ